ncbi:hypothetical protein NSP19_24500, partial [Salmonella enterica]|nr:hypothetical protein [Salmonella enterica]
MADMSGDNPFIELFMAFFILITSPSMFLVIGSTHNDYGYSCLYRIFGEYKSNFMLYGAFPSYKFVFQAFLDFILFIWIYIV